jgi:pyridoxal phosphate enzyme (YggS family)
VLESGELERAIAAVRERIAEACARSGRRLEEVRLIGVTKTVPPGIVGQAAAAGLTEFGENYVQELERKRSAASDATWHYVGRVQRNKASRIVAASDVIHGLEPGRAAERVAAAAVGRPATVLVEVDFTGRRVGVVPDEAEGFVSWLADRQGVEVRGLMTIPPQGEGARPYFARLRELRDRVATRFPAVVELSMGMSADFEDAVEEGATMVRVGTAIFGSRP